MQRLLLFIYLFLVSKQKDEQEGSYQEVKAVYEGNQRGFLPSQADTTATDF